VIAYTVHNIFVCIVNTNQIGVQNIRIIYIILCSSHIQLHNKQTKKQRNKDTHTHTHTFNGPLSGTTQVSQYQKGKTNLDFTEVRDREWQWHQLGHMQICTSLQTNNHASTPPLSFFTGRMPFLPPNQQCQSTEGKSTEGKYSYTTKVCINCKSWPTNA